MNAIRRILCPSDFSDFSRRGLEHATALAAWFGAEVTCLYVHPVMASLSALSSGGLGPVPVEPPPDSLYADELREFVAPARAKGIKTETVVAEGNAAAQILNHARWLPADLIVMGTHGRGGFERWVLGSVTEKVLRKAECPVLTVSRRARKTPASGRAPFGKIVCAVDFSTPSEKAVEFAVSLAREEQAKLILVHAVESLPETDLRHMPSFDLSAYRRDTEEFMRARLYEVLSNGDREAVRAEEVLAWGRAYPVILQVAAERDADLIVMGVHGRNPLDLMMFGSTTHHVVRAADCPVLTLRAS